MPGDQRPTPDDRAAYQTRSGVRRPTRSRPTMRRCGRRCATWFLKCTGEFRRRRAATRQARVAADRPESLCSQEDAFARYCSVLIQIFTTHKTFTVVFGAMLGAELDTLCTIKYSA